MKLLFLIPILMFCSCARTWVNYPPRVVPGGVGADGKYVAGRVVAARAFEANGSDLLGATTIDVTDGGVHISTAGGIDNSTSTKEGYRTVRHGVQTAATAALGVAALNAASGSYDAEQASAAVSNAAASKAGAAAAASKSAETIRLAEIAAGLP